MSDRDEIRQLREIVAELTQRVYRLEQSARLEGSEPLNQTVPEPEPVAPPVPTREPTAAAAESPRTAAPADSARSTVLPVMSHPDSLERRIGSQWLNRVGVVAVLVGVSYFLKLAFDYGWISPGVRVLIGLISGVALCWWSERFRVPNSLAFSFSLKAVGVGILYLSLWASFQLYHLAPGAIVFFAMVLVTAATAAIAVVQDAQLLAGLALLGGLLTPVLCSSGENHEAVLFGYLLLLSLGAFVLQRIKPWPRILIGAFAGSFLLGAAWFDKFYSDDQFGETLFFVTLFFALFAVAPLYALLEAERDRPTQQTGLLLAILNAAAYFGTVYSLLLTSGVAVKSRAAAYAFGLMICYVGLAIALERRVSEHPNVKRLLPMAHYGIAVSFLTIGIALKLEQHWITLGWLLEGAMLFWAGVRTARRVVKGSGALIVGLAIIRLLDFDLREWGEQSLLFNARFGTFVVAIAVILWLLYLDYSSGDRETDRVALTLGVIVANFLALLALGMEIHDYFQISIQAHTRMRDLYEAQHALSIIRNFSYSALFMVYGAALMWLGFVRKSSNVRWQAILLIAITVLKVFFVDISELDHAWRVLSFIILGILLLAVSYAYQRDWLRLQRQ